MSPCSQNSATLLQFQLFFGSLILISVLPPTLSQQLPSISNPVPTTPNGNGSVESTVNQYANGISNLLCEQNPTHILCNTTVYYGHKILQNLPGPVTVRPCSIFLASPHCCAQFCPAGVGGRCDLITGACVCNPSGPPNVCQLLIVSQDYTTPGMNANDLAVLDICQQKCNSLPPPNTCTKAAAATDGFVGTVCFCYC